MQAIEIKRLKKTYKKGTEALKGVSFSIEEGEVFGLLGPNGAGKTTLINILAGVTEKTSGEARVFGKDIDEDPVFVKSSIGVVPQEVSYSPFFSIEDALTFQFGFYNQRVDKDWMNYVLDRLALSDKRTVKPRTLSGGMKRRFMIARALIHKPKVVVLDEPTAGVDVDLRRSLYDFVRELNKNGTTIILTTHYLEEAELLCARVGIMSHGELVTLERVEDLRRKHNDAKLEDIFVELTK